MKTLVLGIGNTLLTDEGAGVHALEALRAIHPEPENVTYLDGGTLSFTLAGEVEEADNLIVIDAAQLKREPGAVACLTNESMDDFLGSCKRSVHEVGLLDLLDIARLTDSLPQQRALVAIQPDRIDWGEQPTRPVAEAIPVAVNHVIELMQQFSEQPQ
jgi:hydrogenase maturation protease